MESAAVIAAEPKPNVVARAFAEVVNFVRALSGPIGLAGGVLLTAFKLIELGAEHHWRFFSDQWQRNLTQVHPDQWPSVLVILTEGLVAAAAISIVFSYTVNNISQRISTIWKVMRPVVLPKDVVRADRDTREWVNGLSAKESREQQAEIERLTEENIQLSERNRRLAQENSTLKDKLQAVIEQLKANERVFTKFENFAAALQKRIANLRRKSQALVVS
jgi:hypothetical protein